MRLEYAAACSFESPKFENMMFDAVDTMMYTVPIAKYEEGTHNAGLLVVGSALGPGSATSKFEAVDMGAGEYRQLVNPANKHQGRVCSHEENSGFEGWGLAIG